MGHTVIPQGYHSLLSLYETQKAISLLKRLFEDKLAGALRLHRVSAPLYVAASSGLNDDLSGIERPVAFDINQVEDTAQVVHSLAKWKRLALKRYQFHPGEGLYTDMNAIRRDEELDNLHSAYVDQWDWEKIIDEDDRTVEYLHATVNSIVKALADVSGNCDDLAVVVVFLEPRNNYRSIKSSGICENDLFNICFVHCSIPLRE